MEISDLIEECIGIISLQLETIEPWTQTDKDSLYRQLFDELHPCIQHSCDIVGIEYKKDVDRMIELPSDFFYEQLISRSNQQIFHPDQLKPSTNELHSAIMQGQQIKTQQIPFRLDISMAEKMLIYPKTNHPICKNGDKCKACEFVHENTRIKPLPPMSYYLNSVFSEYDICLLCYRKIISMEEYMHFFTFGKQSHYHPIIYYEDFGPNGYSLNVAGRQIDRIPKQVGDHSLYDIVQENGTMKLLQHKSYHCNQQHLN